MGRSSLNDENSSQHDGTTMRETQSMLLERIASEMNRLKFYMAHAQVSIMHLLLLFFLMECFSFFTIPCPSQNIDYIRNTPPFLLLD